MPLIDNCQVPDALMDQAHDITAVGGKAFLCIPELPDGGIDGCRNCNATGQLHIQQASVDLTTWPQMAVKAHRQSGKVTNGMRSRLMSLNVQCATRHRGESERGAGDEN